MSDVRHIGPRSLGATLPLPASFLLAAQAFGLPPVDFEDAKSFAFHKRRFDGLWGWEIWLHVGPMGFNLSCEPYEEALATPWPCTLKEARAWAYHFAVAHGFPPMERRKPRPSRPRPRLALVPEVLP